MNIRNNQILLIAIASIALGTLVLFGVGELVSDCVERAPISGK
jgi:hypothetical protein